MRMVLCLLALLLPIVPTVNALAGEADVVDVQIQHKGSGVYDFNVTVRHDDTGWEHYADGWEVVGEDGTQYGYRVLHHPHVNEQPFTRSLNNVRIPESVTKVIVRAHDLVHEWGGASIEVDLTR